MSSFFLILPQGTKFLIPTNCIFVLLANAAGQAVLSEWALKLLAFLTTSKLLVAGSNPPMFRQ